VHIEEELFDVADGYRPLIAVGKTGRIQGNTRGLGVSHYLDDSEWQDYVAEKIRRAERFVMLVKDSDGVRWELARVIRESATLKTVFLLDPGVRTAEDWETLAKMVVPLLQSASVAPPGFEFQSRPIGFFFQREEWWRL
jgi:hypothetical protein